MLCRLSYVLCGTQQVHCTLCNMSERWVRGSLNGALIAGIHVRIRLVMSFSSRAQVRGTLHMPFMRHQIR